jgi:hypothetical protein
MAGILAALGKALMIKKLLGKTKEKSTQEKLNLADMITDRIKNEFSEAFESGMNDIFLEIDNAIAWFFDPIDEATKTAEEMGATALDQEDISAVASAMHEFKLQEKKNMGEGLIYARNRFGMFHSLFHDGTDNNIFRRGYDRTMQKLYRD